MNCKIDDPTCVYHACMNDKGCQKKEMLEYNDYGPGRCEEKKHMKIKVGIIGSAGIGKSVLANALLHKLNNEGKIELVEINENNLPKPHNMNDLQIDEMMLTLHKKNETLFIEKQKKPHHDRNVRRNSRKSRW